MHPTPYRVLRYGTIFDLVIKKKRHKKTVLQLWDRGLARSSKLIFGSWRVIMDRKLLYTYGVRVPHPDGYYSSKVVIGVARNSCSRTVVAVVHLCALVNGGQHLLFCCCTNARWCMCMCVCFVLVFVFVFVLFCFVLFFFVFFLPLFRGRSGAKLRRCRKRGPDFWRRQK